jgi:hypothetical protein
MTIGMTVEAALAQDRGLGVVLLLNEPLEGKSGERCRMIFACSPTIVADESLWGYHCSRGGFLED